MTFQIIAENQKLEVREKVMILREIHENKRKQNLPLFQNPVLTISNLWDSSKQCSSKFFEHRSGSLGKDVLPTAWIHARRIATSSGNLWKRILGSFFLFLAWILHSKATQCGILLQIYREHGNRAPSYVIIPESLARRSKWRWREVRTRLEGLSSEAKKKNLERENIFVCKKFTFGDLKSILGDIFLKSGSSL